MAHVGFVREGDLDESDCRPGQNRYYSLRLLAPHLSADLVVRHCSRTIRIPGAKRDLEVFGAQPGDPAISAAAFINFYEKNLHPEEKSYAPLDVARALLEAAQKRGQAQVLVARKKGTSEDDTNSSWDAAIACVWDDSRLYYWMSARRRETLSNAAEKPHADAIKLLITTAISHAHSLGRIFDADGVPIVDGSPDEGKNALYKRILKIPHEESRDVYSRPSWLYRSFTQLREKVRGPAKKIVAR